MNIIIVNDYASIQGGAAQVAITSAKALAETGCHITFIYASGGIDPMLIHYKNIHLINLHQYDLLTNPSKLNAMKNGIWNNSVEKKIKIILNSFNKDNTIVHIHSWVKSLSASAVSIILKQDFPTVLTLHDYFTICPNGGLYNYKKESACSLKPMSIHCLTSNCDMRNYPQKLWRYLRQSIYPIAGIPNQIKHFIYVSNFSKEIMQPYLPINSKLWNIPNPIDIPSANMSDPSDSETFSFIGRLSKEKGAILFAKAGNQLKTSTRFVGEGELRTHLETINQNAEFTGWKDRFNVIEYIQNSRAIIFPSQLYETQGMVVAEAAALGIPAIVSDSCAASEYIEAGKTGLLFESGNVQSLMEKIKLLLQQPELANKLGSNAYKKYWNNPDNIEKHTNNLLQCYKEMLND